MMATRIPVAGLFIEIDPNDVPASSRVSGTPPRRVSSSHGLKSTLSMSFEPCGVKQSVTVDCEGEVWIEVTGIFGHNMNGAIIAATLVRTDENGAVKWLKNGNLAAGKVPTPLDFVPFHLGVPDTIDCPGTYEYELYLRQTSSAPGSGGYLGRRGQDAEPNVETVISIEVLG